MPRILGQASFLGRGREGVDGGGGLRLSSPVCSCSTVSIVAMASTGTSKFLWSQVSA